MEIFPAMNSTRTVVISVQNTHLFFSTVLLDVRTRTALGIGIYPLTVINGIKWLRKKQPPSRSSAMIVLAGFVRQGADVVFSITNFSIIICIT